MIQKCSLLMVLEIFFKEPTSIHFIREISKKIQLAPTSVRKHVRDLVNMDLLQEKESRPFDGFISNRDNEKFIFYKKVYNLYSLYEVKNKTIEECYPKAIILFGSYLKGEDFEGSDVDILIISKSKKEIDFSSLEKKLKRRIHYMFIKDVGDLDKNFKKNILNGYVLYGSL